MLPPKRQNLLFSATITPDVEVLLNEQFNSPERIEAAPTGTPLLNITQLLYPVPNFYTKVNLLRWMLETDQSMTKILIFTGTKSLADDLYEQLQDQFGEVCGVIHSNKEQNNRFNTVRQFNDGSYRFIIATDIVARGLDISEVSHVINFDIPDTAENYVHRIGRTGRAEAKGMALSFMTEKERPQMEAAEELMHYKVPEKELPGDVAISDQLTDDERPKVTMRNILIKLPDISDSGGAFHEKLAKNKKVNGKVSHKDKMMAKYGKPQKRTPKKR
jgi:ATP-dependent RNA helicase RhlE